ncbi:MAG: hypothetical protein HC876_23105, partial [Chloroflexaceae bacterium]|nr:hypothetical protein [Chloroflexaceae bacterium]
YNLFDDPRCDTPRSGACAKLPSRVELAILTEYGWQDLHGDWTFDRPWIDGTWRHVPPAATRRAYLERLARLGLTDTNQRIARARDAVPSTAGLLSTITLLVVDGFDQFTPLQLSLLVALVRRIPRSYITLTWEAGTRPALRRFARTYQHLVAAFEAAGLTLHEEHITPYPSAPALTHLRAHLFDLDVHTQVDAAGSVATIEAADREREVRAVLRRVRALLDAGTSCDEIGILLRNIGPYAPLLREVATEYNLKLALYHGRPLLEAPSILARVTLLRLWPDGFLVQSLAEIWRGFADGRLPLALLPDPPVLPFSLEQAASMLERAARQYGIPRGYSALHDMLTTLPPLDDDEQPALAPSETVPLLALLEACAAWLNPPATGEIGELVDWVLARTYAADGEKLAAVDCWQQTLGGYASAAHLLNEPPLTYSAFLDQVQSLLRDARFDRQEPLPDCIAVLPVLAGRGWHWQHIFMMGMTDGEFPLALPEPVLYSRRERARLARQGVPLPLTDPADERSICYEAVAQTRRSLTLSRTYLDDKGNVLPVSPFWRAVLALLTPDSVPHERIVAGSLPTFEQAVSPQERWLAWMQHPVPVISNDPTFAHIQRASAIEATREGTGPYTAYEGVLLDAATIAAVAQRFGAQHRWSVTQFNDYITCPFRFAAAHILRLSPRSDDDGEDGGLARIGIGRLYHAILRVAGEQWAASKLPFHAQHETLLLALLHQAATEVLATAPTRYGFEPGAFWEWEKTDVRQRLDRAVRRLLTEGREWHDYRVTSVEQGFGVERGVPPLVLETVGGRVQIAGRIDRIDQREDGALALIDYKSSSTPRTFNETLEARDVQLPVYVLAAEALIAPGQFVERAAYVHLGSGKRSKALTDADRAAVLEAAQQRIGEVVRGVQSGDFRVRPRDKCPTACAFQHICRRNLRKRDAFHYNPVVLPPAESSAE